MDEVLIPLLVLVLLGALLLGPIGFFWALDLRRRLTETELRLQITEQWLTRLESRQRQTGAPISSPPVQEQAGAPEALPDETARLETTAAATEPTEPRKTAAPSVARVEPPPAAPKASLEERIGARWAVIVGGLALAVGLVLMVRFSIEQGLLGPGPRTILALLFSAALVGAGEWLRRRDVAPDFVAGIAGRVPIPATLTAAGTIGAFGSIYAAHALYDLVPPLLAFLALAAVAVAAMVAAVLHGPALAALGIVGSFVTPLLVQAGPPQPWPLVAYVAVVAGAAHWIARTRRWLWLALAAIAGAGVWSLLLTSAIEDQSRAAELFAAAMIHALIHLALSFAVFVAPHRNASDERPSRTAILVPAGMALLLLIALAVGAFNGQFGLLWMAGVIAGVGMLAAGGALVGASAGLSAVAGLFVLLLTRIWPQRQDLRWTGDAVESFLLNWLEPQSPMGLLAFVGVLSLGVMALSAGRLKRSPAPALWASLTHAGVAAATPVLALGIVWLRQPLDRAHLEYAAAAGALALIAASAAATFRAIGGDDWRTPGKIGVGFLATGSLAALALGFMVAISGGHLIVALSLTALAAAWIGERERIPALRWAVAALGIVIAARLAWDPRIVGAVLGATPVVNWLLLGYGVPAVAFAASARLLRRDPEDLPVQLAQGLAIAFAALLCFFQIRHGLNGGDPFAQTSSLAETGLQACAAFGFAIVTTLMTGIRKSVVLSGAALLFGLGAIALALFGLLLTRNPFFSAETIEGGGFVNTLLIAYLMPAALAAVLSRVAKGRRPEWYRRMAFAAAVAIGFTYVNLQTRRFFRGDEMEAWRGFGDVEDYTYSAIWLALGLALLAYGVIKASLEARIASALLIVAATFKVFVFDVSGLSGGLRALSFLGLGLVLVGIGYLYQKLSAKKPDAPPPQDAAKAASPPDGG